MNRGGAVSIPFPAYSGSGTAAMGTPTKPQSGEGSPLDGGQPTQTACGLRNDHFAKQSGSAWMPPAPPPPSKPPAFSLSPQSGARALVSLLCAALFALFVSCGEPAQKPDNGISALTSASLFQGPAERELLERYMPFQMADGIIKVAVIRNLAVTDHTSQYLEGCIAEGRALGFTLDTFITEGDNTRCRELIEKITAADYDGIILSHGDAEFDYRCLEAAIAKNIQVVTFDALPYRDGRAENGVIPGVTSTAQDDEKLARVTLERIVSAFAGKRPRVIRVWPGPGIPPLDRRQMVYDEFVRDGKIEEAAVARVRDFAFARSGSREALTAVLLRFPPGTADVIWAPYDEFAKGCMDALDDAGRTDLRLVSVDISNDDIRTMVSRPAVWIGTAAVDPAMIGIVNVRMLAAKFAGETIPREYHFDILFVETSALNKRINMATIASALPGWGLEKGLFDGYPWMKELKAAGGRFQFLLADNDK